MNFFDRHPILTFLLILFVPGFIALSVMKEMDVSEDTQGMVGTIVCSISFIGAFLFAYRDRKDESGDKFRAFGNGVKSVFKFIIGLAIFALVIFLIILTLPMQLAFLAWMIRIIIVVGGIALIIALVSSTIGN